MVRDDQARAVAASGGAEEPASMPATSPCIRIASSSPRRAKRRQYADALALVACLLNRVRTRRRGRGAVADRKPRAGASR